MGYLETLNKMRNSNLKVLEKVLEKDHKSHQRKGGDRLENEPAPDLPRNHQQSLLPSKRARHFGVKSNQMFAPNLSKLLKHQRLKRNRPVDPNQDRNPGRKLSENRTLIHYQSPHAHHGKGRQKHLRESCPRPNQDLNLPSRKESQVLKNDQSVERVDQKVVRKVHRNESKKVRRSPKKAKNKRIMFMNQSRRYGWYRRLRGARKKVQRKAKKLLRKRGDKNDKLRLLIPQQRQLRLHR